jgi:hypothetical protein
VRVVRAAAGKIEPPWCRAVRTPQAKLRHQIGHAIGLLIFLIFLGKGKGKDTSILVAWRLRDAATMGNGGDWSGLFYSAPQKDFVV